MDENLEEKGQGIPWRSLTFQLLAIVVIPLIVLLLAITFGSTALHENAMRELVGSRDERVARMAAIAIEDHVQWRESEILALAGQMTTVSGTGSDSLAAAVLKNSTYSQPDFDTGVAALGKDGRVIAFQGNPAIWREQVPQITAGLDALEKGAPQEVYVSNAVTQSGKSTPIMIVMALAPDRQSIVAGAFTIPPLVEHVFINSFPAGQEASIALIAPNTGILYQKGFESPSEIVSEHVGVAEAFRGESGTTYIEVDGSEHVVAYSPVTPFGWALLIEEPWEQVASPILQTTHLAPLVMVPVLLLALLAIFFGIRQIVQPLQALATQSGRLGWGDYTAIEKPVGGVSEIRQLHQELVHMARKLRAAQQSLHSYIGSITSGQEEERRRLARELHDDTIQSLIAFKHRVQLAMMDWEGHPVTNALGELENATEQTIENLRRMISALRPIYLEDLGLIAAVNMLASGTSQKMGIPIDFKSQGSERRLEAQVELALYRIVQEALNNIARHSGATHAMIRVEFHPREIQIIIEDNGTGFSVPRSPAEFASSGHFGLLGMFERADLIGGEIEVDSKPAKGTRLVITAPYILPGIEGRDSSSKF